MSQISRTATAVVLTVVAILVAIVNVRADEPRRVIRIYDSATHDLSRRTAAMRTAAAIVADAGVSVAWLDCGQNGRDVPCEGERGALDFVVRIVPEYVPTAAGPGKAVLTSQTMQNAGLELGFAAVNPTAHSGVLATIYHDRVQAVAFNAGLGYDELLGRAMAHEIGHLLLPSAGHGDSGLMRAVWTGEELTRNRPADWRFAPTERRQLVTAAPLP